MMSGDAARYSRRSAIFRIAIIIAADPSVLTSVGWCA
jgi:hypothetical protein